MSFTLLSITWMRPAWLLAIPLLLLIIGLLARRPAKANYWQQKLPATLQPYLLNQPAPRQQWLKWLLLSISLILTCITLAGPHRLLINQQAKEYPAVMLMPLSDSMLASDWTPNRLQYLREWLLSNLQQTPASLGWVLYAGSAHTLLPPNQDFSTLTHLLRSLEPSIMPKAGQRAELAIEQAQQLLSNTPHNPLFLLTDRISIEEQQAIQQLLERQPNPLYIIPIGTDQGAPYLKEGQLARNAQQKILLAKRDLASLHALAKATNGQVIYLEELPQLLTALTEQANQASQQLIPIPMVGYLLLSILLLTAFGARQGWLLLLLIMIHPTPSYATSWDDLWWRKDQQAMQILTEQPAQAAQLFTDFRWQAVAYYQAGQYREAAHLFAQGSTASDAYNQGNALFMAGDLLQAQQAFELALTRQPNFPNAQHNLQLTEQALLQLKNDGTHNQSKPATTEDPLTAPIEVISISATNQASANGLDITTNGELSTLTLEAWLEQIPDNPSLLLKKKFWLELQAAGAD